MTNDHEGRGKSTRTRSSNNLCPPSENYERRTLALNGRGTEPSGCLLNTAKPASARWLVFWTVD